MFYYSLCTIFWNSKGKVENFLPFLQRVCSCQFEISWIEMTFYSTFPWKLNLSCNIMTLLYWIWILADLVQPLLYESSDFDTENASTFAEQVFMNSHLHSCLKIWVDLLVEFKLQIRLSETLTGPALQAIWDCDTKDSFIFQGMLCWYIHISIITHP